MNMYKSQRPWRLRLNPEARGLRGSFCSGSRLSENFQDFLLITKNVTIAPTTSKHITIAAMAPPCSLECLLPLSDGPLLLLLLGGAGRWGWGVGTVPGGGGGAGSLLNEFPVVLRKEWQLIVIPFYIFITENHDSVVKYLLETPYFFQLIRDPAGELIVGNISARMIECCIYKTIQLWIRICGRYIELTNQSEEDWQEHLLCH